MIFLLVAMTGLEKCSITSAYLQWLCHSGEWPVGLLFPVCVRVCFIIIIIIIIIIININIWQYYIL